MMKSFLREKAATSSCRYRIAAIAFDKKGNVLGHVTNRHSCWDVVAKTGIGRAGTARHAERILMAQYGKNIKTIMIARVGHGGDLRPIDPCHACQKLADKMDIRICSLMPGKAA